MAGTERCGRKSKRVRCYFELYHKVKFPKRTMQHHLTIIFSDCKCHCQTGTTYILSPGNCKVNKVN